MLRQNFLRSAFALLLIASESCLLFAAEGFQELAPLQLTREERALARQYGKGDVDAADAAARGAFRKAVDNDLRRLTQAKEVARYGDIRKTIYSSYLAIYKAELKPVRAEAISRIVTYAEGVAKSDKFSPQSRVNFVALLAELDDQPRGRSTPPLPAVKAFKPLYQISNSEQMPLYLRCIALHGLERQVAVRWHAPGNAGWSAEQKQGVQALLTKIITSQPKSALDKSTHQWMVRRAYDCLAAASDSVAVDPALKILVDAEAATSSRLTAANYLCQLDSSTFQDAQKQDYLIGLGHFVRSGLVEWYEREDDLLQRASGATGGDDYGGGYGGMGGGMGGMGGGYGDGGMGDMGDYGGGAGGYGDEGGYGSGASTTKKSKAVDTQDWQTILSRRRVNQIAQTAHLCLDGKPAVESNFKGKVGTSLMEANFAPEVQELLVELIAGVDSLQTQVNDIDGAANVNSLLQLAEPPIEEIMDLVLEIPGFTDKYPDLKEGDELDAVADAPTEQPAGEGDAGGDADGNPEAGMEEGGIDAPIDGAAGAGN